MGRRPSPGGAQPQPHGPSRAQLNPRGAPAPHLCQFVAGALRHRCPRLEGLRPQPGSSSETAGKHFACPAGTSASVGGAVHTPVLGGVRGKVNGKVCGDWERGDWERGASPGDKPPELGGARCCPRGHGVRTLTVGAGGDGGGGRRRDGDQAPGGGGEGPSEELLGATRRSPAFRRRTSRCPGLRGAAWGTARCGCDPRSSTGRLRGSARTCGKRCLSRRVP